MDGIGNITQTVLYSTLPWVRQKPGAMDCEACICDDCVAAIGATTLEHALHLGTVKWVYCVGAMARVSRNHVEFA